MPTATRCSVSTASRVFFPDPDEVAFARRVIEAIPDGRACT
jgi:citrate lyase beta subunit